MRRQIRRAGAGRDLAPRARAPCIKVSVAFPPDTDTPQLQRENETRPLVTQLIAEGGGVMTAQDVAQRIIRQAEPAASCWHPRW